MSRIFSIRPGMTMRGRKSRGLRGWSGKPSHPPLTDVPVGCYTAAAVLDIVSYVAGKIHDCPATGPCPPSAVAHDFFIAATLVMTFGFVISLATALTGFMDYWKGIPRQRGRGPMGPAQRSQVWRTINWHATVMVTMTVIALATIVVRFAQLSQGRTTVTVVVMSVVVAVLVTYGAGYGGELVYEYQFNVESLKDSTVWDETEEDELPGRKRGGQEPRSSAA